MINSFPFTRIDFQKPTKVWSRKYIYYNVLSVIKNLVFAQINVFQLDDKFMNRVFSDYDICEKGYELWKVKLEGSKFIIECALDFVKFSLGKGE